MLLEVCESAPDTLLSQLVPSTCASLAPAIAQEAAAGGGGGGGGGGSLAGGGCGNRCCCWVKVLVALAAAQPQMLTSPSAEGKAVREALLQVGDDREVPREKGRGRWREEGGGGEGRGGRGGMCDELW